MIIKTMLNFVIVMMTQLTIKLMIILIKNNALLYIKTNNYICVSGKNREISDEEFDNLKEIIFNIL